MRVNPFQSSVKSVYKTHIDAIHFRKTDEKRLHGLDEEAEQKLFTEERVQVLKELAAKPDVYERLSSALAPSIYEHEDIKKVRLGRLGEMAASLVLDLCAQLDLFTVSVTTVGLLSRFGCLDFVWHEGSNPANDLTRPGLLTSPSSSVSYFPKGA